MMFTFATTEFNLLSLKVMGIITSSLSYYLSRTDDPDAITGLTSRNKYVIKSSWAPVKKDLTGNGVVLLILFFEKFPEEKQHFPFKDVPNEELKTSKKFHAHCNNVMVALDALIENLGDGELLVNLLEKIGKSHKRHVIASSSFKHLKAAVLELFGTFMNKESLDTWDKLLDIALSVINKYL